MKMPVIEVTDLIKTFSARDKEPGLRGSVRGLVRPTYRHSQAVKGISFSVDQGERVAFIGPNGAGKSTTI